MAKAGNQRGAIRPAAEPYLARRLEKLRAAMGAAKTSALLVTNFADVSWLTGFEGDDSFAIVTPEKVILISDSRYEEQIGREAPWVRTVMRKKLIWHETAKQLKRLKLEKISVQAEAMTLAWQAALKEQLTEAKASVKIGNVPNIIVKLRHIKDAHEVAITEEAIRIAEGAFVATCRQIRAGATENDVAGRLGYEMRKRGALNSSFDSIVAAGANGSLPHYRPGNVKIAEGSSLLVDWGARHRGYCSDLTRVVFLGKPLAKMREIYQVCLEAQLAGIASIKPGMHGKKVDRMARKVIEKAGYGKQFGHGLGHGIGRDIHEGISLSKLSKTTLEPGMIVTVEPGIYLPGVGGVRIEDDVLVTETGHRVLSNLGKDLAGAEL